MTILSGNYAVQGPKYREVTGYYDVSKLQRAYRRVYLCQKVLYRGLSNLSPTYVCARPIGVAIQSYGVSMLGGATYFLFFQGYRNRVKLGAFFQEGNRGFSQRRVARGYYAGNIGYANFQYSGVEVIALSSAGQLGTM